MGQLELYLRKHDGVARVGELLAAGASRRGLEAFIRSGAAYRPSRGVVALPDADPVIVRCLSTNSLLTCASAARRHGLWLVHDPEHVHVLRPDGHFRSDRAVVHRGSWVPAPAGSRIASMPDVVLHALQCLPELEALVVVESAIQQGLAIDFLRAQLPGPRNTAARKVLGLVDKGADSLIETLARELMRRAGFHVEAQVYVPGVGWMDTIVQRCVNVELDGRTHEDPESRRNDYARDARAQALGFGTVRFSYADVVYRPEQMVARVQAVVDRRLALGHLPSY